MPEPRTCRICGGTAKDRCHKCGADICLIDTRFYVDEANIAITRSAQAECSRCAPPKYPRPYEYARAIERGEWDL